MSFSIIYFIHSFRLIITSRGLIFFLGCILALSPVTVAWTRFILTESISISLTLLIFAEIIKLISIKKINYLRISFFITIATFIRIDLIFLFLPLLIAILFSFELKIVFKKLIIIFLIFLTTWSLWFLRNYYH